MAVQRQANEMPAESRQQGTPRHGRPRSPPSTVPAVHHGLAGVGSWVPERAGYCQGSVQTKSVIVS